MRDHPALAPPSARAPSAERGDGARSWPDDDFDAARYLLALRRGWLWVLCGTLLGIAAGAVWSATRPVIFEASTTLTIAYPAGQGAAETSPQALTVILQNVSLAAQVIDEVGLARPPHSLTPQRFVEDALLVEALPGTNIIRVRVRLPDPALAAEASRRLSLKAIDLTRSLNEQEGSAVQERLKEHLAAAAGRLAAAEKELLTYQQRAQVELLKQDTDAMLSMRGDLLDLGLEIEGEKSRLAAASREIARQAPVLAAPRAVGAEQALRGASAGDDAGALDLTNPYVNPVYQTLELQIATSRTKLAALEERRRQLVEVRKLDATAVSRLNDLYGRQMELARLQAAADLAKRVHTDLSVRFEDGRTRALGNSPLLQLVDGALPPDRAVARRRSLAALVGGATGLLAAALLVLVRDSAHGALRAA